MEAQSHEELVVLFNRARQEQLVLCARLEEIADSLPHLVDRQMCIHTARALGPVIDRAHRMEEEQLFPAVAELGPLLLDPEATFERLRIEHAGDEYFAEELIETLLSFGAGTPLHSAEAAGYMLRGFFEALRRHLAFEHELISPVLIRMAGNGQRIGD